MNIPYRPLVIGLAALAFSAVLLERAQAGGGHFFPPVADPVVKEECGSCHIAFAPSMLPARSWQAVMGDLKNHFGDNASIDAEVAAKISAYLAANAADAVGTDGGRRGNKLLRDVSLQRTPLRITELPRWVREHRKVADWEWKQKDVRTRTNCAACHTGADRGYYGH